MTNKPDHTSMMISPADFVSLYMSSFGLCLTGFQRQSSLMTMRERIAQGRQSINQATATDSEDPPHSFA